MCLAALIISISTGSWRILKYRVLQVYMGLASAFSFLSIYITWELRFENIVLMNVWSLVSLVLLSTFFYFLLKSMQKFVLVVFSLLMSFLLWKMFISGSIFDYESESMFLEAIYFVLLSIIGFYHLFVSEESPNILTIPEFWILSGTLMYFAGALFTFLLSDRIITYDMTAIQGLWYIHNIFNVLRFILYGVAFVQLRRAYIGGKA